MGAPSFIEFRRIALHPPQYSGVSDGDPAFPQQFFAITITQGIASIPPHAAYNDCTNKVTPFEEWGLNPKRSPVI